ncbi:hypothetical protein AALP_AAs67532U001300 [Arabis alpina]|uniref:Uncharacterized protein n=1 Tax=Arabis alpina TaxID=50452 RepID=A0A087G3Y7_ARAAL|nr:hypothetical protein AALP_AAs67532U001300 [Arabis alpina]
MGLLLGDIEYSKNGSATALIWGASPQIRQKCLKRNVRQAYHKLCIGTKELKVCAKCSSGAEQTTGR